MKQFVEVHYLARSGMRQAFYDALMQSGIADKSRAEEGNEMYAYWFSPDNENELLLLEIWRDAEAVRLHGETPHFKALGDLKAEYVAENVIRRYTLTEGEQK